MGIIQQLQEAREQIEFTAKEMRWIAGAIRGLKQSGDKYVQSIRSLQEKYDNLETEKARLVAQLNTAQPKYANFFSEVDKLQRALLQDLDDKLEGLAYYKPTIFKTELHEKKVPIVKELRQLATIKLTNLMQVAQLMVMYRKLCAKHAEIDSSSKNPQYGASRLGEILRGYDPSGDTHNLQHQFFALMSDEDELYAVVCRLRALDHAQAVIDESTADTAGFGVERVQQVHEKAICAALSTRADSLPY